MEADPTVLDLKARLVITIVNQAPQMQAERVVERADALWAWIANTTPASGSGLIAALRNELDKVSRRQGGF